MTFCECRETPGNGNGNGGNGGGDSVGNPGNGGGGGGGSPGGGNGGNGGGNPGGGNGGNGNSCATNPLVFVGLAGITVGVILNGIGISFVKSDIDDLKEQSEYCCQM